MKLKSFLLLFVINLSVHAQVIPNTIEEFLNHTLEACKVRERSTDADIFLLFSDAEGESLPDTREGKCFFECFFEEVGIVRVKIF